MSRISIPFPLLTVCLLALAVASDPAPAQISTGEVVVELETVAGGLPAPLGVTHAGDGSGRLFIWDQTGLIFVVKDGIMLAEPFLDISSRLPALNPFFDERGLLGLAFHPGYASNGRLFVRHSVPREGRPGEPCFGTSRGCHSEVLEEFSVSAADPDRADPASGTVLFEIEEPQFNHNAGGVAFGPDGYLYFSLGDGGGAGDGLGDTPPSHGPTGNGQNIETALGSILRIDVDGGFPYAMPADNPFVGALGLDEIFAYGMRNPFRFSFDDGPGGDGRLLVADVGQNLFEEVNVVERGGNYGWVIREGAHCFDPFDPLNPPATCAANGSRGEPLLDPLIEYSHEDGGLSVIGGFVSRGFRAPGLLGRYVFGDFSGGFFQGTGRLYYLDGPDSGPPAIRELRLGREDRPYGLFLKGFGEDEAGDLYVCGASALAPAGDTGLVQRIVELCPEEPDPRSQGYWHRRCLALQAGGGGFAPGPWTGGHGPRDPTEARFGDLLSPCAGGRLAYLGFAGDACEGLDARPASDPCERALKQLTALALNVCSGALTDSCPVEVSTEGCAAETVGDLIDEAAALIHEGDCRRAASCAAAVNEGSGLAGGRDR